MLKESSASAGFDRQSFSCDRQSSGQSEVSLLFDKSRLARCSRFSIGNGIEPSSRLEERFSTVREAKFDIDKGIVERQLQCTSRFSRSVRPPSSSSR